MEKFPLIQLPRKSEVLKAKLLNPSTKKFPLIQLPRKSEEILPRDNEHPGGVQFPLIQLPRKSEALKEKVEAKIRYVSINSTSEEVRSRSVSRGSERQIWFPLIQLPRKSEVWACQEVLRLTKKFPLIQLPRKSEVLAHYSSNGETRLVSINSTSEEVRRLKPFLLAAQYPRFPLIQLPRKSEVLQHQKELQRAMVSINSTSEEVRSLPVLSL